MHDESLSATSVRMQGQRYGAQPDERGPLGGGAGYHDIFTAGDFRVADADELINALRQVQAGQVIFIEPDAEIDMTVRVTTEKMVLSVPGDVTIASNRGQHGTPGGLIYSDQFDTTPLFKVKAANIRFTGLRLRGPDLKRREDLDRLSFGPEGRGHAYYYKFPISIGIITTADGLHVDNCEFSGWSESGIYLQRGRNHHVHHNHIHHNQREALGYGVCLDISEALIAYNVFNYNRHSIAATGRPGGGYEAAHNLFLEHGQSHAVDMHGGNDRQDGTQIAGSWLHVHHNTFRLKESNKLIGVRGVPETLADVHHNWFCHFMQPRLAVRTMGNTHIHNNVYGMHSPRLAVTARWQVVTAPVLQDNGTIQPGSLRLELENPSCQPCSGTLDVEAIPAESVHLAVNTDLDFAMQPGERLERDVTFHVTNPARASHQISMTPRCDYGQAEVPTISYPLDVPLHGAHALPGRSGPANWQMAGEILEGIEPHVLQLNAHQQALLRMATLGNHLVIEAMVDDAAPTRAMSVWEGSTVELFGAESDSGPVGQVILVPQISDQYPTAFFVCEGEIVPAPSVSIQHVSHPAGFGIRAMIPLTRLQIKSDAQMFLLDSQVSWQASEQSQRQFRTLFGSLQAYTTPRYYGRMRIEPRDGD